MEETFRSKRLGRGIDWQVKLKIFFVFKGKKGKIKHWLFPIYFDITVIIIINNIPFIYWTFTLIKDRQDFLHNSINFQKWHVCSENEKICLKDKIYILREIDKNDV